MKISTQLQYKPKAYMVRWQPYQQQRQIRVPEPSKQSSASSKSEVRTSSAVRPKSRGRWYHANLEGARELILEANEFGLVWGVTHEVPDDDGEFKLRLLQRSIRKSDQQEEQQHQQHQHQQQQRRPVNCVEMSRESLDLLVSLEPKIRSLMLSHDKAIIFQNIDVQVYVMEEEKNEGFRVHFQDKRRTKVSLTYLQFLHLMSAMPKIDSDYVKYRKKLRIKKNKLKLKGINVLN